MKIRDLKRKVGSSIVPSWPPARVTSFRGGGFPFGENSQARGRGRSMRREHDFPQPAGKERAERRGDPPLQRHEGGETWAHIGNPVCSESSADFGRQRGLLSWVYWDDPPGDVELVRIPSAPSVECSAGSGISGSPVARGPG